MKSGVNRDKSNESYNAEHSFGAVYYNKKFVEGIPWCVK